MADVSEHEPEEEDERYRDEGRRVHLSVGREAVERDDVLERADYRVVLELYRYAYAEGRDVARVLDDERRARGFGGDGLAYRGVGVRRNPAREDEHAADLAVAFAYVVDALHRVELGEEQLVLLAVLAQHLLRRLRESAYRALVVEDALFDELERVVALDLRRYLLQRKFLEVDGVEQLLRRIGVVGRGDDERPCVALRRGEAVDDYRGLLGAFLETLEVVVREASEEGLREAALREVHRAEARAVQRFDEELRRLQQLFLVDERAAALVPYLEPVRRLLDEHARLREREILLDGHGLRVGDGLSRDLPYCGNFRD